jgi:hypothetical protein
LLIQKIYYNLIKNNIFGKYIFLYLFLKLVIQARGLGIGDWGLGIGDWGLGPIPNPQSPIPNPHHQSPLFILYYNLNSK